MLFGSLRYLKCVWGFHEWKYLISSKVCLRCGKSVDVGEDITTALNQSIYKLKNQNEIREAQVFIEYMNRNE